MFLCFFEFFSPSYHLCEEIIRQQGSNMSSGGRNSASKRDENLKVAIIGTGIAGETAAYLLTHCSPTNAHGQTFVLEAVYESRDKPGLHANSLELTSINCVVDVPLRAVSPHYYPNLFQLYKHLSVRLDAVDYSSCGSSFFPNEPIFRYRNFLFWGRAFPMIFLSDLLSWTKLRLIFRLLRDLLWLVFTGPYFLLHRRSTGVAKLTLGQFLRRNDFSYEFVQQFLYPVMSTLLSCSYEQVDQYPCDYILEFYSSRATTIFTGWFRVRDGVQAVSGKLLSRVPAGALMFERMVSSVEYVPALNKVRVIDGKGIAVLYDRVIIATEPHIAAKIWRGNPRGVSCLASIASFDAHITVHTDDTLMPSARPEWRGLNYFRHGDESQNLATSPQDRSDRFNASMTSARLKSYHPRLRGAVADSNHPEHFETWNAFRDPQPGTVVQDIRLTRAVWSAEGRQKFDELFASVQGEGGIYLIGSYAAPGVTLLEQAVTSACRCARDHFGASVPFDIRPTYEHETWSISLAYLIVHARRLAWLLLLGLLVVVLPHCWND